MILRLRRAGPVRLRRLIQYLGQPVLRAALRVARFYRPTFHQTSPHLYKAADATGVYPLIDHYHEPLALPGRHTSDDVLNTARSLPGIDLRMREQLKLLGRFGFQTELASIPATSNDVASPRYDQPALPPADAQVLHSLIRLYKPRRLIEIGSGESSRFVSNAMQLNHAEGAPGTVTCVEPYEAPWLSQLPVEVIRDKVEDLPHEFFTALNAGDILFIDSSHVARPGGDVPYLYTEILPRLRLGVVVHVHDIFTPRSYPPDWVARRWLWDEQYVVEALLTRSSWLSILLAVNYLARDHRDSLMAACPHPTGLRLNLLPTSMWLQVSA